MIIVLAAVVGIALVWLLRGTLLLMADDYNERKARAAQAEIEAVLVELEMANGSDRHVA